MAIKHLTNIDLNKNSLQFAALNPAESAPSNPVQGEVYFNTTNGNKKLYVYNGSGWDSVSGDISNVIAGAGLTGGGDTGEVTLNVIGGSGITASADDVALSTIAIEYPSPGTSPAGSYGSSTAIPVIAVDAYGRIKTATTASISTDLTIAADNGTNDTVALGADTLTFAGTANEIDTTVSNNQIQIGLVANPTVSGNLIISGNLTVSGTTTTVNTETINLADNIITLNSNETGTPSEHAGIEVERGTSTNVTLRWNETSDIWQLTKDGTNYKTIQNVEESTFATSIGDGSATSYTVTHNLGTRDVIVQLYDNSTYDTVYADVKRLDTGGTNHDNIVTIDFTVAPISNDIRVLITKIG
jgi:hypothetical protein|tara:strand:+ start:178 stop:1248 length:1071 start_codon:yes stop_codon:yes gene_type:complete